MRIVAGIYGGRRLEAPQGRDVRPTSDKVRGAIFNALASRVDMDGARVLDVFCGSGALGLEAISRGAQACVFIDKARSSLELARKNADVLGLKVGGAVEFVQADAASLSARAGGAAAQCVFLDPPYGQGLVFPALAALHEGGWLAAECICVVEVEKAFVQDFPAPFMVQAEKIYGDTKVFFLRYPAPAERGE